MSDERCEHCGAEKVTDYELGGLACPNLCTFRLSAPLVADLVVNRRRVRGDTDE